MIISFEKKFVFVAIPKTGSMAMHEALFRYCEHEYSYDLLRQSQIFDGHATLQEMKAVTNQSSRVLQYLQLSVIPTIVSFLTVHLSPTLLLTPKKLLAVL